MRRVSLLVPVCFLLVLLCIRTDGANAAVFCVNKPPCALGTEKATIDEALEAAQLNGQTDTVFVGGNEAAPYNESPSYVSAETVHIVGDGVGQTIVHADESGGAPSAAFTVLSSSSTIEGMTIRAPDKSNGMALRWDGKATAIRAEHVGSTATETLGMRAEGNAVLEDSTVDINGFGMFELLNATGVKIIDSTLIGDGLGINVGGGSLTLERSTVTSKLSAVQAGLGSSVNIYNALIRLIGPASSSSAISMLSGGEAVVRHATIVGAGVDSGITVDASTNSATVNVFDSIIDNFALALRCNGTAPHTATLNASYSNWTDPTQLTDAECASAGAGNDTVTEPVYASTKFIPNFRLKAPSPLIDAADPADPLGEDLSGAARPIDGDGVGGARSDMGAYEYQRQAPQASIQAPNEAAIGETAEFRATGSSDPDAGDVLTYAWDFGDGGTAEGFAAQHAFTSGGTHTVELTATDPTGLSDSATAQVQVPAADTGSPGGPGEQATPKAVAKISELRAVPKRIRHGKGLPKLVRGLKKPGFQFKLSKSADLVLTLVRCKGRSGCKKSVKVPGSVSFVDAPAGKSTIKFRGQLTRRMLRRGRYRATLKVAGGSSASVLFRLV